MYKIIHVISRRIRWDTRIYLEGQGRTWGGMAGRKLERGGGTYSDTTVKFYYTNGTPLWELEIQSDYCNIVTILVQFATRYLCR